MSLGPNAHLGPYEIVSAVGAGGMGEVYRARDTRLDRIVAIKILPPSAADDPEARQRFEREARTISQINHPHICTLHDVGHQEGIDYLVFEYLEGETLARKLSKGALPIGEALAIAVQVADALDTAHRAGIVHRDLKPGNIMLVGADRRSGTSVGREQQGAATAAGQPFVKLLDFGIAKPLTGFSSAVSESAIPVDARPTLGAPLRPKARFSAPCSTWRPSSSRGRRRIRGPTSGHSAASSMKCSVASRGAVGAPFCGRVLGANRTSRDRADRFPASREGLRS